MTRKFYGLLALPTALAAAVPAPAQTQPSDIKCLLLSNMYANRAEDEKARATALQASFFYLGRVYGPVAQIQARLQEEAKALSPTGNADEMAACANAMVRRAEELATDVKPKPAEADRPAEGEGR